MSDGTGDFPATTGRSEAPGTQYAPAPKFLCDACATHITELQARDAEGLCEQCRLGKLLQKMRVPAARRWLLSTLMVTTVASGFHGFTLFQVSNGGELDVDAIGLVSLLGDVVALGFVTSAAAWCFWHARVSRFLSAIGKGLEFGPRAAGWFFVPGYGLYKPYQATRDLWRASSGIREDGTDGTHGSSPPSFRFWWFFWVVVMMAIPRYIWSQVALEFVDSEAAMRGLLKTIGIEESMLGVAGAFALRVTSTINSAVEALTLPVDSNS